MARWLLDGELFVANMALGQVIYHRLRAWIRARERRSHDAVMLRIARLELTLGVGLFYAQDWLRECPKVNACWCCGSSLTHHYMMAFSPPGYARPKYDPELESRLCSSCIAKVDRELAAL